MKLKRGEELETGFPWFWLALSLTQREKLFNEQTTILSWLKVDGTYPSLVTLMSWSGSLSHRQYVRAIKVHLKLITKRITVQFQFFNFEQLHYRFLSHQRQFSFKCKQSKGLWVVGQLSYSVHRTFYMEVGSVGYWDHESGNVAVWCLKAHHEINVGQKAWFKFFTWHVEVKC